MKEEQAREMALGECCEKQNKYPIDVDSFRDGWAAGVEYANRWTYLPELPTEYTTVLVTLTNGTVTLAVVTKDKKILNVDGNPFTKYSVIAWRELPEPADIR